MRTACEALPTRFDTFARLINGPQFVAVIFQVMRPSSEPGSDFQNRVRRQTLANPRKNCAGPLRGRTSPRFRPFLACLFPVVLHRIKNRFMASKTDQIRVVHDVMMEEFTSQCSRKKAMRKVLTRRSINTALMYRIWQQRLLPPQRRAWEPRNEHN